MPSTLVVIFVALATCVEAFMNTTPFHTNAPQQLQHSKTSLSATTLTHETTWKLRFLLQGLPTEKGKRVDEIFDIEAKFIELEGYEPPQGEIQQVFRDDETASSRLKVTASRWKLSEDPNERKDGLWVWGLFKEPLYPFLLLQLETERVSLPGDDDDAIKPLKLFAQLNHKRDNEVGVVLKGGDLKVREVETVKADPFGAATVDVYEEVSVGKLNIQPMATTS